MLSVFDGLRDVTTLSVFVRLACEHYRKFQRRANRNDEVQHERVVD